MNRLLSAFAVIVLMMSLTSARAQNPVDNDAMSIQNTEGKILAVRVNNLQLRVENIRVSLYENLDNYQVVNDLDGKIVARMKVMVEFDLKLVENELNQVEISFEDLNELSLKLDSAEEIVEEI